VPIGADEKDRANALSRQIIAAAIEVHRNLGPGLIESVYETCRCHELSLRGIAFGRQVPMPVEYKMLKLDAGYRLDILVDGLVIVELKAAERIEPIYEAQLLTYLKLTHLWLGLLVNFNVPVLKDGLRRLANG
jgi:GxxExxY protein